MNVRHFLCLITTIIATGALAVSCNSGTVSGLGTSDVQVGTTAKDKSSHLGVPLPVSAVVFAENNIASFEVQLKSKSDSEVIFVQSYTEGLSGKTKADFSEDVVLPAETEPGEYLVTLKVTDEQGNEQIDEVNLKLLIDSSFPAVGDLDIGINAAGNDLHLESNIAAANKIAKITVLVKGEEWEKEVDFAKESMVGKVTLHFHEHVHVDEAPAGKYQVTVTVIDQDNNQASESASFTKN